VKAITEEEATEHSVHDRHYTRHDWRDAGNEPRKGFEFDIHRLVLLTLTRVVVAWCRTPRRPTPSEHQSTIARHHKRSPLKSVSGVVAEVVSDAEREWRLPLSALICGPDGGKTP